MPIRSIESRLERLESTKKGTGRFIVMSCRNGGTLDGATAYFHEDTGISVDDNDQFVLLRKFYEPRPGEEPEPMLPMYAILTHIDGHGVHR